MAAAILALAAAVDATQHARHAAISASGSGGRAADRTQVYVDPLRNARHVTVLIADYDDPDMPYEPVDGRLRRDAPRVLCGRLRCGSVESGTDAR